MQRRVKTISSMRWLAFALPLLLITASAVYAFPQLGLMHGVSGINKDASSTSPVFTLHMDGANNSVTLLDASGGAVTAVGNAKLTTTTAVNGTASLALPGTVGSYVKIAPKPAFAMGTANFTVEAFIKTTSTAAQTIIGQWDGTNAAAHTIFAVNNGQLQLYLADISVNAVVLTAGSGANDGKWHHVAYTRSGNVHTLWLDGTAVGNVSSSAARFVSNLDIWIGQYQCCNQWPFNGFIDEVRLTKGVALYSTSFLPPTTGLYDDAGPMAVPNLKFWLKADTVTGIADGSAVASWSDSSGNGFHATQATGTAQPLFKTNQFNGLPGLRFDGVDDLMQANYAGSITDKTMCAVTKLTTLTPTGTAYAGGPLSVQAADGTVFDAIIYNEVTAKRWMNGSNNLLRTPSMVSPADEYSTGPILMCIRSTSGSYAMYRNAVPLQATSSYSPPTIAAGKFNIAYRHSGAANGFYNGDVAEVLVYDRAITNTERQLVETYFFNKYGLLHRNCSEILNAGQSVGDGVYTVDPDSPSGSVQPLSVYCDMTTDGGGWTLVAATNSSALTPVATSLTSPSTAGILNSTILPAIAQSGSTVRLLAPAYSVNVKSIDSFPISRLRSYYGLSDDATMTNAGAHWSPAYSNLAYTCACTGNQTLSDKIYHACCNGTNGLHWIHSATASKWSYPDANTTLTLWVK